MVRDSCFQGGRHAKRSVSADEIVMEEIQGDGVVYLPTFIDSGVSEWDSDVLFGFNLCVGIGQ